ncbi:helix-turn-helix domain-containing protein [Geodermatophilus sp. SYSU D00814]
MQHAELPAAHVSTQPSGDLATVRVWFEFGEPAPTRQALELAVATLLGIVRELLGRTWEPLSLCFTHPAPASPSAHLAVFGPRLRFGHDFTGPVFHATVLDAASTTSDPLLRPYARQLRQAIGAPPAETVTGRVTQLAEMLLPLGRCSTQQVARSLGMTPRTLHRRPAAEGHSFSSIVHGTREAMAERHLATDRYSLTDVSELLGFTAPSAFSRWFRQRRGVSPTEWRARAGRAGPG